jgi:hypothetical protein
MVPIDYQDSVLIETVRVLLETARVLIETARVC